MGKKPEEKKVNGVRIKHWCYVVTKEEEYRGTTIVAGVFDEFKDSIEVAMALVDKNEYVTVWMMEKNCYYDSTPNTTAFGYWSVFSFRREHN